MTDSKKWLPVFLKFIELLRIDSKETPAVDERGSPLKIWGSQRIFLEELAWVLSGAYERFLY